MSIKKIPCGGFSYDDSEITFENGVIHPIGGGGGAMVVHFSVDDSKSVTADKTVAEVENAMKSMPVCAVFEFEGINFDGVMTHYVQIGDGGLSNNSPALTVVYQVQENVMTIPMIYALNGEWVIGGF